MDIGTDTAQKVEREPEITRLINELKRHNPSVRFAIAGNGSGIGVWDKARNLFVAVIEKSITGEFVYTGGNLPLVNGKAVERNWQEV